MPKSKPQSKPDTAKLELWVHTMHSLAVQVAATKEAFVIELGEVAGKKAAQAFQDALAENQTRDPFEIMFWMEDAVGAAKRGKPLED